MPSRMARREREEDDDLSDTHDFDSAQHLLVLIIAVLVAGVLALQLIKLYSKMFERSFPLSGSQGQWIVTLREKK